MDFYRRMVVFFICALIADFYIQHEIKFSRISWRRFAAWIPSPMPCTLLFSSFNVSFHSCVLRIRTIFERRPCINFNN
jgi:hypothetical protein